MSSPTPNRHFPHLPISVPDQTGGFFIGWRGHNNQPLEIKHYIPPWNDQSANLDLPLEQNAYVMQVSPSGKFLAVGHASGSWEATLYDLEQKQLLKTIPHVRATSSVQFTSRDLATFCTHSIRDMFERKQEPFIVQIWNYLGLA